MDGTTVCDNCIRKTGGCCTNINLVIHETEIKPFKDAKEKKLIPATQILERISGNGNLFLYQTNGERCVFLTSSNTCSIYDRRPTVCSMYPIVWKKTAINPTNLFIDLLCPLTHSMPIKDLYKPSTDIKKKKMIKEIGSLVFDSDASSYLNISDIKRSSDVLDEMYQD